MKLLVATRKTQGKRGNDFFWAEEGEIVKFGMDCDREEVDGRCGCRRSMCGIHTHKATTTMVVSDMVDMTRERLVKILANNWIDNWKMDPEEALVYAEEEANELIAVCKPYSIGSVLERRGDTMVKRI